MHFRIPLAAVSCALALASSFSHGSVDSITESALVRLDASGTSALAPAAVTASAGSTITIASTQSVDGASTIVVQRLLVDGRADPSFAGTGRVALASGLHCVHAPLLSLEPDQTAMVVVVSASDDASCSSTVVRGWKIGSDGQPVPGFAISGLVFAKDPVALEANRDLSGRLLLTIAAGTLASGESFVARFDATGAIDPAFGTNARITIESASHQTSREARVTVTADRHLIVAANQEGLVLLTEWSDDGKPSPLSVGNLSAAADFRAFARLGETLHLVSVRSLADGAILIVVNRDGSSDALIISRTGPRLSGAGGVSLLVTYPTAAAWPVALPLSDGSTIIAETSGSAGSSTSRLRRMYADSSFDVTWGPGRAFEIGGANVAITAMALDPSGRVIAVGRDAGGAWLRMFDVTLRPNYAVDAVVEFFNSVLGHYFVTADSTEISLIQSGRAGFAWSQTGFGFRAHPTGDPVPDGSVGVCRFYGNQAIDPATGQPFGPNSHVYVLDGPECAAVKRDRGWVYEGIVFRVYPPKLFGACEYWQVPVNRLYNGGAARNDSNHRYVTTTALVSQMTAAGWINEGTVMCTP